MEMRQLTHHLFVLKYSQKKNEITYRLSTSSCLLKNIFLKK